MGEPVWDASELTEFGRRVAAAHAKASVEVAKAVKKGAQNVKDAIRKDVASSGNAAIRRVAVGYELGTTGSSVYADVSPREGGASSLANIAFFGTARGGGTHRFYEHAEEELPALAEYVGQAADDMLIGALGL